MGAGIVGACCALSLQRAGLEVTVIDAAQPGGPHAASFGNGAWISPGSIVPMATPDLWKKVPGYLLNRQGPLTINPGAFFGLIPWLTRFLLSGATNYRVEQTAEALNFLLHDAPMRHVELAQSVGLKGLIVKSGLLHAYPDEAAYEKDALAWSLRAKNGIPWVEHQREAVRKYNPQLSDRYTFGAVIRDGAFCRDPEEYVRGIVQCAVSLGAEYINASVSGVTENGIVLAQDGKVSFDHVVIATGAASAKFSAALGDSIPLRSERGYHIQIADPGFDLKIPTMPSDGKIATTLTHGGLRIAGQVELTAEYSPPNWARCDVLLDWALRMYPCLKAKDLSGKVTKWMGRRPSIADGVPVVSLAKSTNHITYAFGHGHIGLAAAPKTAEIVTDIILKRPIEPLVKRFSALRF
ncbi:NAD(P)/FAD-dependent oxidoreductase [Pseudomonas syringae]|uniref:NAD(P)/FAD-dependent oxidoreductase n=1 Tax=Pseudomonas syringae TaxID=317 RepID=UPI001E36D198|nr:FAD-dependent oxidoreductase [Pseudomonas syringae]